MLLANNLIKGGDLSNAIVIVDRKMDQPEIDRLAKLFGYGNIQIIIIRHMVIMSFIKKQMQ